MTIRWTFDNAPTPGQLAEIATMLTAGKAVLLPTDTIYGLHAVATDARAVGRIAEVKGRDEEKPFVVIGESIEQLEAIGVEFQRGIRDALAELWPAPLTAILPIRKAIAASRGMSTLAVRIPQLAWLRDLMIHTTPLASTSANRSGEPAIESPDQLTHELQDHLDGVADAGRLSGQPSTIVDFTGEPRLIREGNPLFTQKVWKRLRKSL